LAVLYVAYDIISISDQDMTEDRRYFIGVDGGGSNLRVAVVSQDLTICGQSQTRASVNPNVVERETAAHSIQIAVRAALADARLPIEQISAVGVGIAGALSGDLPAWLQHTITAVVPQARVVPGADAEIALVGAHGERRGVLLIAGTGSVAYGINADGETAIAGGWGYLLGDEGSGYWLGLQALRAAVRAADGRGHTTSLSDALLNNLGLPDRSHLIEWAYRGEARTREIAAFAPTVLQHAEAGDHVARRLIEQAVSELALCVRAVLHRLHQETLPIAFAGGLLETPNILSNMLCEQLGLNQFPIARYPPVVGAALLAMLAQTT
jgi:N-acetylglucosamine kinase-like BadF-type ATPase